jgi:hypothetical protein
LINNRAGGNVAEDKKELYIAPVDKIRARDTAMAEREGRISIDSRDHVMGFSVLENRFWFGDALLFPFIHSTD